MAKRVAAVVGFGVRAILHDDWTWTVEGPVDALSDAIRGDLEKLGRYGRPVPNLYDTAIAGAGIVPGGEITRWWGDHTGDRERAIAAYRRREGGPAGGPIPSA